MKRIIFPVTNRAHMARQKLLLEELKKQFIVDIFQPRTGTEGDLETYAILAAIEFKNFLAGKNYDYSLIRADRFELLLLAGICAYRGIRIAHIEGGADSGFGVIDTRVRNAITQLADLHFVTDESAYRKVAALGANKIFNVGSLDVSFAEKITQRKPERIIKDDYLLLLHHGIPGEETSLVVESVKDCGLKIVGVKSNSDYVSSLMVEEYSPEDFISLMMHAKVMVGNSSAICKEASILGTPCVLVGNRQNGRIVGRNVIRVPYEKEEIMQAVAWQIEHGAYKKDQIYFQRNTEKKIVEALKKA